MAIEVVEYLDRKGPFGFDTFFRTDNGIEFYGIRGSEKKKFIVPIAIPVDKSKNEYKLALYVPEEDLILSQTKIKYVPCKEQFNPEPGPDDLNECTSQFVWFMTGIDDVYVNSKITDVGYKTDGEDIFDIWAIYGEVEFVVYVYYTDELTGVFEGKAELWWDDLTDEFYDMLEDAEVETEEEILEIVYDYFRNYIDYLCHVSDFYNDVIDLDSVEKLTLTLYLCDNKPVLSFDDKEFMIGLAVDNT